MSENICNIKRHNESKHSTEVSQSVTTAGNAIPSTGNAILATGNAIPTTGNTIPITGKTIPNKCDKCGKDFTRKYGLNKHLEKCKGILNKLECEKCHEIFTFSSNLSRHRKICENKQLTLCKKTDSNNITNNIINSQNANTINNNTINITNNNNNLIVYDSHNTVFDTSHITERDLKRIFNGQDKKVDETIVSYSHKLLENKDNRCIRKRHLTNSYCEVYLGDGKWEIRPDTDAITNFSHGIVTTASDTLYDHEKIGSTELRKEIDAIASWPDIHHSSAINIRRGIRSILLNTSIDNKNEITHV
jgi:hypothetical protein